MVAKVAVGFGGNAPSVGRCGLVFSSRFCWRWYYSLSDLSGWTEDVNWALNRRCFLSCAGSGLGAAALASLLDGASVTAGGLSKFHFAPTAKRVIFLHQSGAPSQIDLFDPKPELWRRHGQELPASVRGGQRLTTMTSMQEAKPLTAPRFRFTRWGMSGADVSELLPYTGHIADNLCFLRAVHTEAINHDPAITFLQTGSQQPGRPSMGAWTSYGLGSENHNLPAYVVFISGGQPGDQPLFGRLWGSGFLPGQHQGVKFRGRGDAVLYLSNPPGINRSMRRRMLDLQADLNRREFVRTGDPEIQAAIAQAEIAHGMQMSVPELQEISGEAQHTLDLYGPDVGRPGSYAANCLLARRLIERGVRFVQLYHRGWDHHVDLPRRIREKARETDQPSAGLVADLKRRGLLDDTLVVWAGEFGRTAYCQGELTAVNYGRDHHPRCFTVWLAGGGIRPGCTFGATDDFSYNVVENGVHVHDLQATVLHCLGLDHERLTFRFRGRDYRLTDIAGTVVHKILT